MNRTNYPCHYQTRFTDLATLQLVALADAILPVHEGELITLNDHLYKVFRVEMFIDYPHGDHANFIQRVSLDGKGY